MNKKLILLLISVLFLSCNKTKKEADIVDKSTNSIALKKGNDIQIETVKRFMKWYIQNQTNLYKFNTIGGGPVDTEENEEVENYFVNFEEVEKYIAELKKSGLLSDAFLQKEKQTFIDGEKYFKENPENDGPPYGFDYDHFFLTQEAYEEDLLNIETAKYKTKQTDDFTSEVEFYLPICAINYKYTLKKINSKWFIDKIESLKK